VVTELLIVTNCLFVWTFTVNFLWPPRVADADIIFLSCGFFYLLLSFFFFPRLCFRN